MKNKMLSLGALLALSIPVVTIVSCNGDLNKKIDNGKKAINLKIENLKNTPEKFQVKEDGLYLFKDAYNGDLYKNETVNNFSKKLDKVKINSPRGWSLEDSVMLGNNDSFYMIYDNDDSDDLNPNNFNQTLFFEDTSVMGGKVIAESNKKLGNTILTKSMTRTFIPFVKNESGVKDTDGNLNTYIGGQNNHQGGHGYADENDFQKSLNEIYEAYKDQPSVYKAVLKYYGMKTTKNKNGIFIKDSSLNGASRSFAPVVSSHPIFTYEWIYKKVVKITYHSEATWSGTAAHMVLKEGKNFKEYGSFSMGSENEWSSYRSHNETKYIAHKNKV